MLLDYPYEKASVRGKRTWDEAAAKIGCHPIQLREYYSARYFTGMQAKDFFRLLDAGRITIDPADLIELPPEELEAKNQQWQAAREENDFCDLLNRWLKELIEVGDYVMCDEDKTYTFSGIKYKTAGKKYRITELKDEGGTELCVLTTINFRGQDWESIHGVRSLWRKGREIWNWNLAYLALWQEQNPGHEQTQAMIIHCTESAQKSRKGKKE